MLCTNRMKLKSKVLQIRLFVICTRYNVHACICIASFFFGKYQVVVAPVPVQATSSIANWWTERRKKNNNKKIRNGYMYHIIPFSLRKIMTLGNVNLCFILFFFVSHFLCRMLCVYAVNHTFFLLWWMWWALYISINVAVHRCMNACIHSCTKKN